MFFSRVSGDLENGERRITSVASGFLTKGSRSRESSKLLNWGMRTFDTIKIAIKDEPIESLDVWLGKKTKVAAVVSENIYLTVPKRKKKIVKAIIEYNGPIEAPISKGDKIGLLNIYIAGELDRKIDIFSNEDIKKTNVFSRLLRSFNYLVWGDV